MAKITIKDLLEAGCHFGHQTKRWNPKMKEFVYGTKNGISIIDLTKTMHQINDACNFLQKVVMDGGNVLFVGTKRQAQQIIREAAEETGMYYISNRWLGGTLTNNQTIRKSITKMRELDELINSDAIKGLKKKEIAAINRRNSKLHRDLDGIAEMKKLPDVMVIVDISHDNIAVREANKLNIPTVAIVDTNSDPSLVDYPLAANDDAVKSIKVIMDVLVDAIKVASELYHKRVIEEKKAAEAEAKAKAEAEAGEKDKAAEGEPKEKEVKKAAKKKAPAKKAPAKKAPAKKAAKAAEKAEEKAEEAKADDKAAEKADDNAAAADKDKNEAKAEAAETKADDKVEEKTETEAKADE